MPSVLGKSCSSTVIQYFYDHSLSVSVTVATLCMVMPLFLRLLQVSLCIVMFLDVLSSWEAKVQECAVSAALVNTCLEG
jgi:hypothetical protein